MIYPCSMRHEGMTRTVRESVRFFQNPSQALPVLLSGKLVNYMLLLLYEHVALRDPSIQLAFK